MKDFVKILNIIDTIDFFISNPNYIAPVLFGIVILSLIGICLFGWAKIMKILASGVAIYIALQGIILLFNPRIEPLAKILIFAITVILFIRLIIWARKNNII